MDTEKMRRGSRPDLALRFVDRLNSEMERTGKNEPTDWDAPGGTKEILFIRKSARGMPPEDPRSLITVTDAWEYQSSGHSIAIPNGGDAEYIEGMLDSGIGARAKAVKSAILRVMGNTQDVAFGCSCVVGHDNDANMMYVSFYVQWWKRRTQAARG